MLNPNSRSLYTSALMPPPGMIFDEAIATTFSMDPELLLEAPLYLALMAVDCQVESDPLSVLEAIRRYSARITVYLQKGRIQVPQIVKPNPLFGFLEDMIVEVQAPGGGVFHPKVWAIRFVTPDRESTIYRLVVLSRNMTSDKSWDLALQIEGSLRERKLKQNKPLAYFFKSLPELATRKTTQERSGQAKRFSEELYRVCWEVPKGFEEVAFYIPGMKEFAWRTSMSDRMAVITPFCTDGALQAMVKQTKAPDALISRPEALSGLKKETREFFSKCLHLDEAAEIEDGEEENPSEQTLATGLHAKAYLFEKGWNTEIVVGSANATNAALISKKNLEILVSLTGKRSKVGGIDELLGDDGMGEYLIAFDTTDEVELDLERREAEELIEKARLVISDADLSIKCRSCLQENLWTLELTGHLPNIDGITSIRVWPITLRSDAAVNISAENDGAVILGEFSASSVTGLIAFELETSHPEVSTRFVLNLPITGVPADRNSAILQTVIRNREGFIKYLLLLLSDDTAEGNLNSRSDYGFANWLSRLADGEDIPLLEELTRTYCRYPQRLAEISRLVREISQGGEDNIIPKDFLKLWTVFEAAIRGHDA